MMKNSKLSKLLVAGVSVAMLASALAPMAFAEEGSGASAITTQLVVGVYGFENAQDDTAITVKDDAANTWATFPDNGQYTTVDAGALVNGVSVVDTKLKLSDELEIPDTYTNKGEWVVVDYNSGTVLGTYDNCDFSIAELYNLDMNQATAPDRDGKVVVFWKVKSIENATLTWDEPNVGTEVKSNSLNKTLLVKDKDGVVSTSTPDHVKYTDTLVLPYYVVNDGYTFKGISIKVENSNSEELATYKDYKMSQEVAVSSLFTDKELDAMFA